MNRLPPKTVRRRFFIALGHAIHVTWPVLSAILAIQVALGLLIGFVEGCRRRGLFHFRHRPHNWLWRYRAATAAWTSTCDRDWFLRALPHGPHSRDCGLCHAHGTHRPQHQLTTSGASGSNSGSAGTDRHLPGSQPLARECTPQHFGVYVIHGKVDDAVLARPAGTDRSIAKDGG